MRGDVVAQASGQKLELVNPNDFSVEAGKMSYSSAFNYCGIADESISSGLNTLFGLSVAGAINVWQI